MIIVKTKAFLRLKVIRQIPHFAGFSCYEVLHSEESAYLVGVKQIQSKYQADLDDFEITDKLRFLIL